MTTPPQTDQTRAETEAFFRRRGVPQLVEGYGSEARIDARAAPWIVLWLLVGTVMFWGVNPAWSVAANAIGISATLAFIFIGLIAMRLVRGGPLGGETGTISAFEVALLGALPAVPASVIDGEPAQLVWTFLNVMLGIGIIYLGVGFGVPEIAVWAVSRVGSQLTQIIGLLGRTLPLLLILVVFLLFAAELWEAAHHLDAVELAGVLALLLVVAVVLVVTSLAREVRAMEETESWRADLETIDRLPAVDIDPAIDPVPAPRRLAWLERTNVLVMGLIGVLIQALSVVVVVMAFLAVFGLLAVPAEVQAGWIGGRVDVLTAVSLLGENRAITGELLTVSALLAGIVGLYFTGLAVTDSAYRGEYLDRLLGEIRGILAVRARYLQHVAAVGAAGNQAPDRPRDIPTAEPPRA